MVLVNIIFDKNWTNDFDSKNWALIGWPKTYASIPRTTYIKMHQLPLIK